MKTAEQLAANVLRVQPQSHGKYLVDVRYRRRVLRAAVTNVELVDNYKQAVNSEDRKGLHSACKRLIDAVVYSSNRTEVL